MTSTVDQRPSGATGAGPGDGPDPEPWHAMEGAAASGVLHSSPGGLTAADAADRLTRDGPNEIRRQPATGWVTVLARQFTSPLVYALVISAVVALALGEVADGVVVVAVVVLNALIGFVQEFHAGRAIQALAVLVSEPAAVRRDGAWTQVPAAELVTGDVVAVAPGDRVMADLRVLEAFGLRTDESPLTGESLPVDKSPPSVPVTAGPADRTSVLHAGTLVRAGTGQGLVVEVGTRTQLGRISDLSGSVTPTRTPLTRAIAHLGTQITRVIAVVAVVVLVTALVRGYPVVDAALTAITLAVAAIPEGLPAIVTIALAVGVRRMAARGAIVRELPAVETLGSTSVVCTDKTGTLTRNEMVVRRLWTADGAVAVEGTGYAATGRLLRDGTPVGRADGSLHQLLEASVLANEGEMEGTGGDRHVVGDPTDGALLVAAERAGLSPQALRRRTRRLLVPFDSGRQYMASAHLRDGPDGVEGTGASLTYLKGAPEVLLAHVTSGADPVVAARVLDRWADDGLRVLAVAARDGEDVQAGLDSGPLHLLGLVGMLDPPRSEVAEAVAGCLAAGVAVKMITGDHAATAAAIGRELGIVGTAPALTGPEIAVMGEADLGTRVAATAVFARVAPEHKLRLVRALQADGAVVAMTGDGVNDVPALRQADIGLAMGRAGTAAAKEAADIVLADDDFSTIRAAVEQGRRVYDNLAKALLFALPTNVGEGLVVLAAVVAFPVVGGAAIVPIEPVQILWINLVATVSLALPLAMEAREPGLMGRRPRDPGEPLLSRFVLARTAWVGVVMAAVAVSVFLLSIRVAGASLAGAVAPDAHVLAVAQTTAVTSLAFFQVFYLLTCRTLLEPTRRLGWWSNPWVFVGIGALLVLQLGFVHLPPLQELFGSSALDPREWLLAAVAGSVVVPLVAAEKYLRRRRVSARRRG